MNVCKHCHSTLLENAKFCHSCGKFINEDYVTCSHCKKQNPIQANFCANCGLAIAPPHTIPNQYVSPFFKLDFHDLPTLPTQLKEAFIAYVCDLLRYEGLSSKKTLFIRAFNQSHFRLHIFEEESLHLATAVETIFKEKGSNNFSKIESIVNATFLDLSEVFWIKYCRDLHPFQLSDHVLAYQKRQQDEIRLQQMIQDYLQLEEETICYYLHAVDIPLKKLANARKIYYKHDGKELPYLFIDQTILGSAKEGVILSQQSIYWKAHFHRAAQFLYSDISNLQLHKKYLNINQTYFNVSKSLNYKLFKLLMRIKSWNF